MYISTEEFDTLKNRVEHLNESNKHLEARNTNLEKVIQQMREDFIKLESAAQPSQKFGVGDSLLVPYSTTNKGRGDLTGELELGPEEGESNF